MSMAHLHVVCEGCGKTSIWPLDTAGTVQECPECRGYIDVPAANDNPTTTHEDRDLQAWHDEERERRARVQAWYDEDRERRARQNEEREQQVALWHEQHQKNIESTERFDALIERWERMSDRLEKLLDRFDRGESR
jgi:hypothetical protein